MEPTLIADERTQLEEFLETNRDELVETLDGLDEEQARRRLVPSLTTLLGLVKHVTWAEQVWFHVGLAGRTREELGIPHENEPSWELEDGDTIASVLAEYRRVRAEARDIASAYGLDDLVRHNRRGPLTLRWLYLHMIEEVARHAGHADILREQILAADAVAEPPTD
ncbi:MAG TPA: DinB family protein [Marmoricola sp.]